MPVLSPVSNKPAVLLENIPVSLIVERYKAEVDVDVARFFAGMKEIQLYQCVETGYRFFYPFGIEGDAAFYEELQKFPWYYADWKWDYDAGLPYIANGSKVLDVGCGYGNFLAVLKKNKQCDCTGLEFNDKAIKTGTAKELKILKETIEEHAKSHTEVYDVVCSFQVLEHITESGAFIKASIGALKKGGKLLLCVPNNNPYFLQYIKYHSMNMPPHHMGWWDKDNFRALTNLYPIQLDSIDEQTLERFRLYTKLHIQSASKGSKFRKGLLTAFYPFFIAYFLLNRKNVKAGHILAVYTKL